MLVLGILAMFFTIVGMLDELTSEHVPHDAFDPSLQLDQYGHEIPQAAGVSAGSGFMNIFDVHG